MDDCSLKKLSIKPGKLSPAYKKDVLEYNVTVGSNVAKITFDCETNDIGASTQIKNSGGGRSVDLVEGEVNECKIEVTSEDGTTCIYQINVHRLSAKDAILSDLKCSSGMLDPEFEATVTEYQALLPCSASDVTITHVVPDTKSVVTVNGQASGPPIVLNIGATHVQLEVTSPDGSSKKVYSLHLLKGQFPRVVNFVNSADCLDFEDPVSLTALYCPVTVKGTSHIFSAPILDEFTRTSKYDPLDEQPLINDWRVVSSDLDKKISAAMVTIPLTNGETSEAMEFNKIGSKLSAFSKTPSIPFEEIKYSTDAPIKHTLQVRSWEKNLHQIHDETNATTLIAKAEEHVIAYYNAYVPGWSQLYKTGESPLEYLETAMHCYACAIKSKPKDAQLHLKLGMLLEEAYYAADILGIKTDEVSSAPVLSAAKESSKQEECLAICQLRGVDATAPLSLQLKAIDQEYHHLIESGQSAKADHVMALFAWKNKQATQEGAAAQKVSDEESPLGQAYLKYMDALSLDESKSVYHFHVGRMLVIRGDYEQAVQRLSASLGWKADDNMAKFYLGMALSLQESGPGSRYKECISYLATNMESLLTANTELAKNIKICKRDTLYVTDLLRNSNVHLLRGINQLGKLLTKYPDVKGCMAAKSVFHTAALLASQVLPTLHRGDTYKQVEWVLLDAHTHLLDLLIQTDADNTSLIATRCARLSALIKRCTIPQNNDLLNLQQKTCERLVQISPCNSHSLYLLGTTQLTRYDSDPQHEDAKNSLTEAMQTFRASIDLEGKSVNGEAVSVITEQKWWQARLKEEQQKLAEAEASKKSTAAAKPVAAASRGAARGGPSARGATAARGAPAARGGAARGAPARGAPGRGTAGTPARGGVAARGAVKATAPARGGKPVTAAKGTPTKQAAPEPHSCESSDRPKSSRPSSGKPGSARPASGRPASGRPSSAAKKTESGAKNPRSHLSRLGLARAISRDAEDLSEAKKLYNEVIDIAPDLHDAYIESAEMLIKSDPLGAVDIYSRFPVAAEPTFNDAYIFGEIVRLLIKNQKYDDPRLETNMIGLGRVMGLASLEKYVKILEDKFKNKTLRNVYAGVNRKDVEDPEMVAFFNFKCW